MKNLLDKLVVLETNVGNLVRKLTQIENENNVLKEENSRLKELLESKHAEEHKEIIQQKLDFNEISDNKYQNLKSELTKSIEEIDAIIAIMNN